MTAPQTGGQVTPTPKILFSTVNYPDTWNTQEYGVIQFASNDDAKKAELLFNKLSGELTTERERAKGMVPKRLEYRPGLSDYGRGCVAGWNDCIAELLATERKDT